MGKKDKKNKQKQQQKAVAPKQQVVTQAMINEAKDALAESSTALESIPVDEVNVAEIEAAYVTDGSVSSEDVAKCIAEIKKATKILSSTQQRYEEMKSQLEDDKKDWLDKKSDEESELKENKKKAEEDLEKQNAELAEKRKDLNERELRLLADEDALKAGDNSAIIERLIAAFKNSKEEVITAAETHLKEQASVASEYLEKLENITSKESQLEIKEKELRVLEKKVKTMESIIEEEREALREEIQADVQSKFEERLNSATIDLNRYKLKLEKANAETDELKAIIESIQSAFGDMDPEEMATICSKQKEEINELQQELSLRPLQGDLDTKQKQVEFLMQDIKELREKFNEKEYYELKAMFDNNDILLSEKQTLTGQLESAKAQIIYYKDTVEDLRHTISEINESHNKGNAFKSSSKYDSGEFQVPLMRGTAPASLSEFISYLQSFMASPEHSEKERRFYSKDIIKKFIAGLHMSPITILQGISGTGKTSLPRAVAMAMMADDPNYSDVKGADELSKAPYRICPIQSGWRDKMDLMGFYNSFEKSYHETEFFNALYLANQPKYEHILFFIVLDEMNLSRPEHYFADFLSKLELSSEEQRKIKIDNVPEDICPKSIIGGTLAIPKNVRFIGTANHDETTLEFAPKTYDRSNVIEMPRNCPKDDIPNYVKRYNVTYKWLSEQFEEAERKHIKEYAYFDKFIKDDKIIELLANKDIGIGNRFEGQAKRFISVFVEAGDNEKDDIAKAADHLMTTRLFRTLKDNYDLSYDNLDEFKTSYTREFKSHFFGKEPEEAIAFFDRELEKKKQK